MVNQVNSGGGAFPTLNLNPGQSGDVYAPNHEGDTAFYALRGLADATAEVGNTLTKMQVQASIDAGQAHAAHDIAAGTAAIKPLDYSASTEAYNQTLKVKLGADRKAAIMDELSKAEIANPSNIASFAQAADAVHQGFQKTSTGDPAFDVELDSFFTLQKAAALTRVGEGQEKARVETGQASFLQTYSTENTALGQTVSAATFDPRGSALVAGQLQGMARSLAKYGPKEAFDIGPMHFDADPTRLNILPPAALASKWLEAQSQGRAAWILNAAERLPDTASKASFAQQVREAYAKGDPMFAGLDARDWDRVNTELHGEVTRSHAAEGMVREQLEKDVNQGIEAFRYGGAVDWQGLQQKAFQSGNAELIAKVNLFSHADRRVPGVLAEVAAGQLDWGHPPAAVSKITSPEEFAGLAATVEHLESGGVNGQVSKKGAAGLMQVMPGTAEQIHKQLFPGQPFDPARLRTDVDYNRAIGQTYLHQLVEHFGGNTVLTLAAYNAGPGAVEDWINGTDHKYVDSHGVAHETNPGRLKLGDPRKGEISDSDFAAHIPFSETRGYVASGIQQTPGFMAWKNTKEGFASDPIDFAHTKHIADPSPLDPSGAFAQDASAWGAALQNRVALGRTLSKTYGVPARVLTNAEVDFYKAKIKEDPTAGVVLAEHAWQAIGPDGARQVLREVGRSENGVELHIAGLAAMGQPSFARSAIEGLRLQSEGAQPPKFQLGEKTFDDLARNYGPAFGNAPDVLVSIQKTAEAARLSDIKRGIAHTSDYYIQTASGGRYAGGQVYGGIAAYNGRQTVLPIWLAQDHAEDAVRALAQSWERTGAGPVYDNGKPMAARDIARMQMVMRPDGTYTLLNPKTGRLAAAKSGSAYVVNFDLDRDWLASHASAAVLRGQH